MLIEFEELKLTLEVAEEFDIDKKNLINILYHIEHFVENGLIHEKKVYNEVSKLIDKTVYKTRTAFSYIYAAYMKDVTSLIKNNQRKLVNDHIMKYDMMIEELLKDPQIKNPVFFLKRKTDNYLSALDALYQKERLLGLHRKSVRIILNNKIKQQRYADENTISTIDMSGLNIEEKIELNTLLEKAQGVLTQDQITYIDYTPVEDVKHEEVVIIHSPMKEIKQTNIEKLNHVVEKSGTIHTVNTTLQEKFRKLAEQTFKDKGIGNGPKILNPKK